MPLFTPELEFTDDYPTIEPSLKLDFANARALDPRITFTRASIGTYVDKNGQIKTAGVDEPRFDHDPETGEILGLLIEESRINLYPISETFASWNVDNNATKTTDGTTIAGLTAIKLTSNVNTNALFLEGNNATFTANTTYTSSVYHKVGNVDGFWFEARFFSGGGTPKIYFNSSTETWSATSGGTAPATWSVKSQKVESNAWRHSITFYIDTDTAGTLRMGALAPANSTNVSTGDYGYLAAPQIEVGSFPTSYIPTSGSTVTRALEYGYATNMDFYNQNEGSVLSEIKLLDLGTTVGKVIWSLNQVGGFGEGIYFVNENGSNNIRYSVQNSGSQFSGGSFNSNNFIKSAIGLKENSMINYYNGSLVGSEDTSGTIPNNIGRLVIGNNAWGSSDPSNGLNPSNGHIKSFTYYPKRLANAQLQTLTQ